jgi:two-component system, LytTR family, sensor kinase
MKRIFPYILLSIICFSQSVKTTGQLTFRDNFLFKMKDNEIRMGTCLPIYRHLPDTNLNLEVWQQFPYSSNVFMSKLKPWSPIILGVKLNPLLTNWLAPEIKSISKSYQCYVISDSTDAILIAMGITPENVHEYIYHVIENDSIELVPWSNPELKQKYGAKRPYGFLGKYNAPGKQIMVEVVNKNNYYIRDGIVFDWRVDFKPAITLAWVETKDNGFDLNNKELIGNYATEFDPQTGLLPTNLVFPVDSIRFFYFKFKNHETIPYEIHFKKETQGQSFTTRLDDWFMGNEFYLYSDHFDKPGKYELIIYREEIDAEIKIDEKQKFHFKFEILPPPLEAKYFSFHQILKYGSGILLFFLMVFTGYYLISKRRLRKIVHQKEFINLKLKSVQSQLNPHFMFNVLGSIQNLMNKNDIMGANHYLGKFSNLTRKVLDTSDREMISLEDELNIHENYLQMEQLRFDFKYEIIIEEQINKANTEIPSMLLQPFVENAVKHGISTLNKKGIIKISATSKEDYLILSIFDNGTGFKMDISNDNSLGIKLVKERIALLNQSFKARLIELFINSGESGTTIILKFNNWI